MVVVGVDVHKRTHTFVAVNEVGRSRRAATPPSKLPVLRQPDVTGQMVVWRRSGR